MTTQIIPAEFGAFEPGAHHIELASGRYLDLRDPDPAAITVEDIATGLSQVCRFAGQSDRFYSVAEHACLVHDWLERQDFPADVLLAALHHDDAEAFLGDCTRPLKALLAPAFGNVEARMLDAIETALGLPTDVSDTDWGQIKMADDWALSAEAYHLLPSKGATWFCAGQYRPERDGRQKLGLSPYHARGEFLRRHYANPLTAKGKDHDG